MSTKKNVVVVGGGGAGAKVARILSEKLDHAKYNLILVSAHPFYIHYPAGIRASVTAEGSLEDKILIPYDKLFVNNNGQFKQGVVTTIHAEKGAHKGGKVVLENGESIDYEVLTLAPGSRWDSLIDFPYDGEKTRFHIKEWREKFANASKIAIAGGGAVGIELAGELRQFYPDKQVTLVHGEKKLLNGTYPDKFRADLERRLRAKQVRLILDDFIDSFPASETRKGVPLEVDLVVAARGPRPNTSFIGSSLGPEALSTKGLARIRPTLQLADFPNVFAVGDIIDFPEQKQVGKYPGHASIAAPNILSVLEGAEPKKLYKGMFEGIFVSIGSSGGAAFVGLLWGLMFGDWVASTVKSKNLFVSMTRKSLGLAS